MKRAQEHNGTWRRCRGCALLLVLSLMVPAAHALAPDKPFHDYVSDTWSILQGLPQITVLSIAQDRRGYLWFGTQDGVARFDGAEFQDYLPADWAQALLVGHDGTLWIGLNKGVAYYVGGKMHRLAAAPAAKLLNPRTDVHALTALADGEVLAASDNGVLEVRRPGLTPDPRFPSVPVFAILQGYGSLWVGAVGTLYQLHHGQLTAHPAPGGAGTRIGHLCAYNGALWAGTSHGLYRYSDGRWLPLAGDPAALRIAINACYVDSDDNFWVATNLGLARIRDGGLREFVSSRRTPVAMQVESLFEDREHDLWVGTHAHGVSRLWNGFGRRFSTGEGLHDPLLWSVARARDGDIWAGSSNGVYRLHAGRFTHVVPGRKLPEPDAYSLLAYGDTLWIGTKSGLTLYRRRRLLSPPVFAALAGHSVQGIFRDRAGNYWLATTNGLYRYGHGKLSHYGTHAGLANRRCRLVFETHDGRILVGTLSGLYEFDHGRLVPLGTDTGLRTAFVTAISQLADGWLVVGTFNENHLYVFDGSRWHTLTSKDGFPPNTITYMTANADGKWLWVGGIRGIYRIRIRQLRALVRHKATRLVPQMIMSERGQWPGSERGYCCNGAGNARGVFHDDILWLPSRDGLVRINTRHIRFNSVVPNTVVEAIRYDRAWHANRGEIFRLPPQDRDVAFRFSVLSFQNPLSVTLRYRLDGYDRHWQTLENVMSRTASYTNLPPGNYVFEVRGSNNAGVWSPETALLHFTIAPHFYATLWFRMLLVLALLTLIYIGYQLQLRHLRSQRQQLERTVAERTEALSTLNRQLEEASQTDPLTGLKNRRYLSSQLPDDLRQFHRVLGRPEHHDQVMMFAVIDVDHFKDINDRFGHFAGDEILKQFAQALRDHMRAGHYVVRWGGEEFLAVFRPLSRTQTEQVITRVHQAVCERTYTTPSGERLSLTCSIGIAEYPFTDHGVTAPDWEAVVNLADQALLVAKTTGRNRWVVLRPDINFSTDTLRADLHAGVENLLRWRKLTLVSSR